MSSTAIRFTQVGGQAGLEAEDEGEEEAEEADQEQPTQALATPRMELLHPMHIQRALCTTATAQTHTHTTHRSPNSSFQSHSNAPQAGVKTPQRFFDRIQCWASTQR